MSISCNVGRADRIARLLGGMVLIGIAFWGVLATTAAIGLGVAGAVLVGTAAVGFCPLYRLLGLSTCSPSLRTR
jgi:multidrug transporter EmrE-like cation transporter